MDVYQVTFELTYPDSVNDIRTAYVLAESFTEAEEKVKRNMKKEYESVYPICIKKLRARTCMINT